MGIFRDYRMSGIQFILGRSGTGKTCWCIDRICEALRAGGDETLLLLVPEQAPYQAEKAILSRPGIAGFSRLRVLSFERLQHLLNGGQGSEELSHPAKQMILHKILLELTGELKLYKGDLQRTGLAARFAQLLTQLQADNCTGRQVELMAETLAGQPGHELAHAKWSDIAKVFKAYEAFFQAQGEFVNSDIQLKKACPHVGKTAFLHGAKLWVDGFSGFSGQERDLLIELLRVCDSSQLAFCLDPANFDAENDDADKLDPFSLFASAEQTVCGLVKIVRRLKLPVGEPVMLQKPIRFAKAAALASVERNLAAGDLEAPAGVAEDAIQIAGCSSLRAEAMYVAESISELVRRHGMRYRDIAVVLPEMNTYPHYIESAFREFSIPYFLDRPRGVKTHPLAELVGAALQAVGRRFVLSDVLSFVKSGLGPLEAQEADVLETYARAFDIQGAEWVQEQAWDFASAQDKARYDEHRLDRLRKKAMVPLRNLQKALTEQEEITAEQFIRAVWGLVGELEAAEKLSQMAADDMTDPVYGHRQVYEKTLELLDQMHAVFADRRMESQAWASILTDALGTLTVKLIPPTLDQVLVGSIERSRHPDVQAIFLMGAVQKQFPVPLAGESLLTDKDYDAASGLELSSPARTELTARPYLAYIALTRASKRMVLTYPTLDEKGAAVVPWSGIDSLKKSFADLEVVHPQAAGQAERICTSGFLAQWLCRHLGRDRQADAEDQTQMAAGVLEHLRNAQEQELRDIAVRVDQSLTYENTAQIEAAVAENLFARPLTVSASRLATYAACPYQHFAKYALRLERRQLLRFEPLDMGSFYHRVLEEMFKAMQAKGTSWGQMERAGLEALCTSVIDRIVTTDVQIVNFIRRKAHHRCILQSAIETIKGFVPVLAEFARAGSFRQAAAEVEIGGNLKFEISNLKGLDFAKNGTTDYTDYTDYNNIKKAGDEIIPPRPFGGIPLEKGESFIRLSGQIDRLDVATVDGQTLGLVIDYKSGAKAADFTKMYYGLDLQLPIYLLAISGTTDCTDDTDSSKNGKNNSIVPAGAFYLPIGGGVGDGSLSDMEEGRGAFMKAKGVFDGRFFAALDSQSQGGWSAFYNFYVNKEGSAFGCYKTSGAMRPEDFQLLLTFAKRRIATLAQGIGAGDAAIRPYRMQKQSPCAYCDFRAVCRFDWQINDYNILSRCDKETAIERMRE
jgi:ATP-dependent helicase/nuclease subunit B